MGRHLNTRRTGDRGCTKPAGDPSDSHQIRHDVIAGPRPDCLEQRPRPVKVLAELHGRLKLVRELRIAREIVAIGSSNQ